MEPSVEFEDENIQSRFASSARFDAPKDRSSPVVRFLMKLNIVRNEHQAITTAIIVAVVILGFSVFFIGHALAEPKIIELRVN